MPLRPFTFRLARMLRQTAYHRTWGTYPDSPKTARRSVSFNRVCQPGHPAGAEMRREVRVEADGDMLLGWRFLLAPCATPVLHEVRVYLIWQDAPV